MVSCTLVHAVYSETKELTQSSSDNLFAYSVGSFPRQHVSILTHMGTCASKIRDASQCYDTFWSLHYGQFTKHRLLDTNAFG